MLTVYRAGTDDTTGLTSRIGETGATSAWLARIASAAPQREAARCWRYGQPPGRRPERAVGSRNREEWLKHGQLQFDYLLRHGLRSSDRMLEIGCGNLRAGRLFIDYLDTGNYYGLDISPDILLAAQRTVAEFGLQAKLPHLTLVSDLTFGFLPSAQFSVVHAHSVFSHSPIEVISECLAHVGRVMAPGAFFDFTFHKTVGAEHHLLGWAFYYRSETLLALARSHGLDAHVMADWKKFGGPQSKIRVTLPGLT